MKRNTRRDFLTNCSRASIAAALPPDELANESLTDEALTVGVGFALLAGFVEDLQVRPVDDGIGTEVRMVWPVAR